LRQHSQYCRGLNLRPSFIFLPLAALFPLLGDPLPARDPDGQEQLSKYLDATKNQQDQLRGMTMDVDIEAALPTLSKTGKLHALRYIPKIGAITYKAITFQGDNTIKKDVIARYLEAEQGAGQKTDLAITPENYKFKYRGLFGSGDWQLHLFEVSPKRRAVGLFEGWLWLEAKTCLPVREQGVFVRNPSLFLRKVEFVRDYHIKDGVAVPVKIDSTIRTRLVGSAELSVRFSNHSRTDADEVRTEQAGHLTTNGKGH